jgi:hypothetical protein
MAAGAGPTTAGMTELGCHSCADGNPGSCFIRMDPRRLLAGMTEVNGYARPLFSLALFGMDARLRGHDGESWSFPCRRESRVSCSLLDTRLKPRV